MLLLDNFEHLCFDLLFFYGQSIFLPYKVWFRGAETIFLHASLEQADDVAVVRVLGEAETSAIVHEFLELVRLIQAELVNTYLLLLFLDVCVFFLLGFTWKSLPWQCSLEKI